MYNLNFAGAHKVFAEWMRQYPADPMGPVSDAAAYLFSEFERLQILQSEFFTQDSVFRSGPRLQPDPELRRRFLEQLNGAEQLAGAALARNARDTNALFALVLVPGLRSDYEGLVEKRYFAALTSTKTARHAAERLLAVDGQHADAWLAIGVENYLLSLKPLPIRWFLQLNGNATDRAFGIEKVKLTAERGRFLRPFAQLLLAVAALRDKQVALGKSLLQSLSREFPDNHLYRQELNRLK